MYIYRYNIKIYVCTSLHVWNKASNVEATYTKKVIKHKVKRYSHKEIQASAKYNIIKKDS